MGVPPLEVYNQNTVGENGQFSTYVLEDISQTVNNTATVAVGNGISLICCSVYFFARGGCRALILAPATLSCNIMRWIRSFLSTG